MYLNDKENKYLKMDKLNNIEFIGELFNKNIFKINLIIIYLNTFIKNIMNEENDMYLMIEYLCKLLNIVGKKIDIKSKTVIDDIFQFFNELIANNKLGFRYKYMLMDIIDLRKNNWIKK